MTATTRRPLPLLLTLLTAAGLVAIAVIHLRIAKNYIDLGSKPLSLGDQFYAQAAGGIALALGLLVALARPLGRWEPLLWVSAVGFGVVSLAFLVYSRYHAIPVPGLPGGFQESWQASGAKAAAVAESLTILLGLGGLVEVRRRAATG